MAVPETLLAPPDLEVHRGHPGRRWTVWATATAVVLLALAGGTYVGLNRAGTDTSVMGSPTPDTVPVTFGPLTATTMLLGTIEFRATRNLAGNLAGTLTGLPLSGKVVGRGQRLYAVDNLPVTLMFGDVPAWRPFVAGMSDGPDVAQLERNLQVMGFLKQPPDATFAPSTKHAIQQWQRSIGLDQTGELPFGSVVFVGGPLRIGGALLGLGGHVGPGVDVVTVSGVDKVVNVRIAVEEQNLAVIGAPVTIRLPGGKEMPGKVVTVSPPTEVDTASGKQVVVPFVVAFSDPAASGNLRGVGVSVVLSHADGGNVLQVPVTALIVLTGGGLGVEVYRDGHSRRVPVKTGAFVAGLVAISGDGVVAGDQVVVAG